VKSHSSVAITGGAFNSKTSAWKNLHGNATSKQVLEAAAGPRLSNPFITGNFAGVQNSKHFQFYRGAPNIYGRNRISSRKPVCGKKSGPILPWRQLEPCLQP